MPYNKPGGRGGRFFFFPFIAAFVVLILGAVVMFLWNAILPELTGIRPISYWKAVGLLILCRILFGNFGRRGNGHMMKNRQHLRSKWMSMTPEERERFKASWKRRCEQRK